jgi:hypothetical protein
MKIFKIIYTALTLLSVILSVVGIGLVMSGYLTSPMQYLILLISLKVMMVTLCIPLMEIFLLIGEGSGDPSVGRFIEGVSRVMSILVFVLFAAMFGYAMQMGVVDLTPFAKVSLDQGQIISISAWAVVSIIGVTVMRLKQVEMPDLFIS